LRERKIKKGDHPLLRKLFLGKKKRAAKAKNKMQRQSEEKKFWETSSLILEKPTWSGSRLGKPEKEAAKKPYRRART